MAIGRSLANVSGYVFFPHQHAKKFTASSGLYLLRSGIRQNSGPMEIRISGEIHYGASCLYFFKQRLAAGVSFYGAFFLSFRCSVRLGMSRRLAASEMLPPASARTR